MNLAPLIEPFRFRAFEPNGTLSERLQRRVRVTLQRGFMFIEAYWVVADLAHDPAPDPPRVEVEIRPVLPEDLSLLAVRKEKEVREHFAQGDLGFIALHRGELAYVRWVLCRPVPESTLGIMVTPEAGEGYLFDAYTFPAYRGQGLHAAVTGYAMRWLRERDFRIATGIVLRNNSPARQVLSRLGFSVRDKFTLVRFAGRRRLRRRPCRDLLAPRRRG